MIRLDSIGKQNGHQILFIDASMGIDFGNVPDSSGSQVRAACVSHFLPSCSSPPLGGEARRGGNDVRIPLSQPLPLAGERSLTQRCVARSWPSAAMLAWPLVAGLRCGRHVRENKGRGGEAHG
jgi:hypothetical protein